MSKKRKKKGSHGKGTVEVQGAGTKKRKGKRGK